MAKWILKITSRCWKEYKYDLKEKYKSEGHTMLEVSNNVSPNVNPSIGLIL
ncbi:conserved hypothetical protein [Ricinus communis]|uniref:Uncharacterized protein n=1 Tax=Ricinus communis TaxID=3988 RepID=B9SUA0_RICCO|nr:conserved hypothetical protein [Ricinus communis]